LDSSTTIADDALQAGAGTRALLFRVGERTYGIELGPVREIVGWRPPTRLPGSPPHVQGLINLRGTIVTVVDLRRRLDPSQPPIQEGSVVLVSHGADGEGLAGVAVEQVLDVVTLSGVVDDGDASDPVVRGLGRLGEQVVIMVDVHALVSQVLL
jgi:purine-binding chemotaxis protein CheW